MMTGSCVLEPEYWKETVSILIDTMIMLNEKLDITFEFVNIGGGLGIPYVPNRADVNLTEVSEIIASTFESKLTDTLRAGLNTLAMENGRFMTGPSPRAVPTAPGAPGIPAG